MFKDRDEALKQMNDALLEETGPEDLYEDPLWEDELWEEAEDLPCDGDLTEEDPQLFTPQKQSVTGLAITAIALMAAIAGVLIYWVLRFGG